MYSGGQKCTYAHCFLWSESIKTFYKNVLTQFYSNLLFCPSLYVCLYESLYLYDKLKHIRTLFTLYLYHISWKSRNEAARAVFFYSYGSSVCRKNSFKAMKIHYWIILWKLVEFLLFLVVEKCKVRAIMVHGDSSQNYVMSYPNCIHVFCAI